MPHTIFFSWQVDTETRGGRDFIEKVLERTAARISQDTSVEEAVRELGVDRDTKGEPGSPPIVDTIFRKIDQAAVFVPDVTFVGKRSDGRPTSNPNVLIEYGWALKSLSHAKIVPVMNTAYGAPTSDSMPFDMRHLRNPITYHCPEDLDAAARKQVKDQLAKELEAAVRIVLETADFNSSLPKSLEFRPRDPTDGRGRFKATNEPIGMEGGSLRGSLQELLLSPQPAVWFRMMPSIDSGRSWSVDELERAMRDPLLQPLSRGWGGYNFLRSHEGFGIYSILAGRRDEIRAIVFAFTSGEVWSVDTYWLEAFKDDKNRLTIPTEDSAFREALKDYGRFLETLGIKPPFRWIAGMENLKGRVLYVPTPPNHMRVRMGPDGKCLAEVVTESGVYSPGDSPGTCLRPFFSKLYDSCGIPREHWQDP
jgi:hypothetical protein